MEWYYANDGERHGPVTAEALARLVAAQTVRADTLVWRAGMAEWQAWQEVAPTVALPPVETLPPTLAEPSASMVAPGRGVGGDAALAEEAEPLEYGGFWVRLLAKILDGIVLFLLGNIAGMFVLGPRREMLESIDPNDPEALALALSTMGIVLLVSATIGLIYHWFFLARFAATPGKLALGLRIVRSDGSALSHGRIVARFFGEYLSAFILYIGYLIAAFDDEKRTLHDYICDTRVVKKRSS